MSIEYVEFSHNPIALEETWLRNDDACTFFCQLHKTENFVKFTLCIYIFLYGIIVVNVICIVIMMVKNKVQKIERNDICHKIEQLVEKHNNVSYFCDIH